MKRIIAIVIGFMIILCSCTSCFTMMAIAVNTEQMSALGKDKAFFEMTTFQKISPYAALASTAHGDVVCVIAKFDPYYDGMHINGSFVCKGTYTYYSVYGTERNVLVYAYKKDMKDLQSIIEQFMKDKPNVVVDDKYTLSI